MFKDIKNAKDFLKPLVGSGFTIEEYESMAMTHREQIIKGLIAYNIISIIAPVIREVIEDGFKKT